MQTLNLKTAAGRRKYMRECAAAIVRCIRQARTCGFTALEASHLEILRGLRERHSAHFRR